MNNNTALEEILQQPGIWRAGEQTHNTGLEHVSSGFGELDASLPGSGWTLGALTEILHEQAGIGELRLLMPALARLSRQGRWIALIAPPHIPYAPALAAYGIDLSRLLLVHPRTPKEALWALEQALRNGTCGAVLAWPRQIDERSLRRLQLAAESGSCWGVLFRSGNARDQASPAALRLEVLPHEGQALIRVLKCRGGRSGQELLLDLGRRSDHPAPLPQRQPPTVLTPATLKPAVSAVAQAPAQPNTQPLPEVLQAPRSTRPPTVTRSRRTQPSRARLPQLELPLGIPEAVPAGATPTRRRQASWSLSWLRRK